LAKCKNKLKEQVDNKLKPNEKILKDLQAKLDETYNIRGLVELIN